MKEIVYLTGFSGTGKSHVGRLLAERLGWDLVDMDDLISRRAGGPIVEIFELGEEHFRNLERVILAEAASGNRQVVATGGGVPVDERNREVMRQTGFIVCLKASAKTIHNRIQQSWRRERSEDDQRGLIRPMIQEGGEEASLERIQRLLDQREAAYTAADVAIDTDGLSPEDVAERAAAAWQAAKGAMDNGFRERGSTGAR